MNRLFRRILAFSLLLTLCLPSSCALKQGLAYFFSASVFEQPARIKTVKTIAPLQVNFESGTVNCKVYYSLRETAQLRSGASAKTIAMLPFLFFILPGFLISLAAARKRPGRLPIPYAWFRGAKVSVFLQNRLLLL